MNLYEKLMQLVKKEKTAESVKEKIKAREEIRLTEREMQYVFREGVREIAVHIDREEVWIAEFLGGAFISGIRMKHETMRNIVKKLEDVGFLGEKHDSS